MPAEEGLVGAPKRPRLKPATCGRGRVGYCSGEGGIDGGACNEGQAGGGVELGGGREKDEE